MDLSRADKVNALRFVVGQHQYIAQGSQQGNPLEDELPGSQGSLPAQVAVRQHAEYTGSTAAILTVTAARAYAAPAVAGIEPLAEQLLEAAVIPSGGLWRGHVSLGSTRRHLEGDGRQLTQGHLGGGHSGSGSGRDLERGGNLQIKIAVAAGQPQEAAGEAGEVVSRGGFRHGRAQGSACGIGIREKGRCVKINEAGNLAVT